MALRSHVSTLAVGIVGGMLGASLVGGAAYAVNGGYLKIGTANSGTKTTSLANSAGTPLSLTAKSGTAPLKVNSGIKVGNLNADRLDNLDSTAFALAGGKIAYVGTTASQAIDLDEDGTNDAVVTWAQCPTGSRLTGGGYDIPSGTEVLSSCPYNDNTWNVLTSGASSVSYVYAVCYNPRGSVTGGTNVTGFTASPSQKAARALR